MDVKRLEDKLDKMSDEMKQTNERLSDIDKHLAVYNEQLKVHIEGTIQNRESIKDIHQQLGPIKMTHHFWGKIGKGLALILGGGGITWILEWFTRR